MRETHAQCVRLGRSAEPAPCVILIEVHHTIYGFYHSIIQDMYERVCNVYEGLTNRNDDNEDIVIVIWLVDYFFVH